MQLKIQIIPITKASKKYNIPYSSLLKWRKERVYTNLFFKLRHRIYLNERRLRQIIGNEIIKARELDKNIST